MNKQEKRKKKRKKFDNQTIKMQTGKKENLRYD